MPPIACVLFLDMLGFADLVERADDIESFTRRSAVSPSETFLRKNRLTQQSSATSQFMSFHEIISDKVGIYTKYGITAVTFSDSAFVHFPTPLHVITFASSLMRSLVNARIPIRMGIGAGSFRVLDFASKNIRSGHVHTAQFLGTAVVHSYRAESCGLAGMRVFLHPSMRKVVREQGEMVRILLLDETNPNAYAEVNYLFIKTSKTDLSSPERLSKRHRQLKDSVAAMQEGAPDGKHHYYENTRRALNRMFNDLKD